MFSKRSFISVLAIIMVVSLVLTGCGKSTVVEDPMPTELPDRDYSNTVFDGTYWHLSMGPSARDNYETRFIRNGTLFAACAESSVISDDDTYTYDGTYLYLKFGGHNVKFAPNGDGFKAVEEYTRQKTIACDYTLEKSNKENYNNEYRPAYERRNAWISFDGFMSDYTIIARRILNDDINYAESAYGPATTLTADPGYMRFTFPEAPVKFELEYHYDDLKKGTIYFSVADMGLTDDELELFEKGCVIEFGDDNGDYTHEVTNGHNGLKGYRVTIHGFVDGHFTEDAGFKIEAYEFKSSIPKT